MIFVTPLCAPGNVVWEDPLSAERALLGKGRHSVIPAEIFQEEEGTREREGVRKGEKENTLVGPEVRLDKEQVSTLENKEHKVKPDRATEVRWRLGEPHPKSTRLLLRYATSEDKKIHGAAKYSHFYQKYGNPNVIKAERARKPRDLR